MTEPEPCSFPGCREPSATLLVYRSLCREHFLIVCSAQLDASVQLLLERPFRGTSSGLVRQLATECLSQASALAGGTQTLSNLERARLLDIVLWASDLSRHVRRGPRKPASFPVHLHSEEPGQTWQEDTITRIVSRDGAALECGHQVRIGETLRVIRRDTGQQTRARVLFRSDIQSGRQEIGIELLDCENFWAMDWEAAESTG